MFTELKKHLNLYITVNSNIIIIISVGVVCVILVVHRYILVPSFDLSLLPQLPILLMYSVVPGNWYSCFFFLFFSKNLRKKT